MSEFWKRKMRTYFKTWDYDRDGYISEKEYADMARRFAETYNVNDERKERLIQSFINVWRLFMRAGDIEKDGRLTASILIESMKQLMYDPGFIIEYNHKVRDLYGMMDINIDGYLQADEYQIALKHLGVPEGAFGFDAKSAFEAIDVNGDGKLSIDEFVATYFDYLFSQDESSPSKFIFGPLVD